MGGTLPILCLTHFPVSVALVENASYLRYAHARPQKLCLSNALNRSRPVWYIGNATKSHYSKTIYNIVCMHRLTRTSALDM